MKNSTTDKEDTSEPTKVLASKQDIAIAAIEVDGIIEKTAAATKEKTGREMSAAAAKELR